MILWLLSIATGLALAALAYGLRFGASARVPFALRVVVATITAALLFDAPLGPARAPRPWVGLDVSASWQGAGGEGSTGAGGAVARWATVRATVDSLLAAGADSVLLFGDSLRPGPVPATPGDGASRVGPLVEAALAVGRPVLVLTDGQLDDPERVARLPRGSRVVLPDLPAAPDAAVATFDVPGGALGGDTIPARIVVKAGSAGAAATRARLTLDGREIAALPVAALAPYEERELRVAVPVPAQDATRRLAIALDPGDAVPRNDSARADLVVSGAAAAVFVSSAPDQDARFALAVLRGTRRGPVQGFWKVAAGQWRTDGAMRAVAEAAVRAAVASAPLVVLHGDTALFGAPRPLVRGALVLIAPPAPAEDYYTTGTGDSPLVAALAGVPWDSLPPLDVAPLRTAPQYSAVVARRARRLDERVVVGLNDGARRVAVVPVSGLWRWRLRGGRSADAFDAVWGSIFDWVGADRTRASGGVVGADERVGISPEWVPRRPTVAAGAVGDGAPLNLAPRARGASFWWLAAIALVALCAEWLLRRRIGLR